MASIPREKIALFVLTAVILLITAGIAWYLIAGHSWNYAATAIDDAAGNMEDYRIILYEGTAAPSSKQVDDKGNLTFTPVSLASTAKDYEEKGATVFTLDSLNLETYREPQVFERDGYRVGVVYAAVEDTTLQVQEKVDKLIERKVNVVIAIAQDNSRLAQVEGIDAVIDLEAGSSLSARNDDNGFRITMPAVGSIGVIVLSPSDVLSARSLPNR